jgi:hypothetical protein
MKAETDATGRTTGKLDISSPLHETPSLAKWNEAVPHSPRRGRNVITNEPSSMGTASPATSFQL